jgi:hypothetical protein
MRRRRDWKEFRDSLDDSENEGLEKAQPGYCNECRYVIEAERPAAWLGKNAPGGARLFTVATASKR